MEYLEAMLKANKSQKQLVLEVDDAHCSWDSRTLGAVLERHNGERYIPQSALKAVVGIPECHEASLTGSVTGLLGARNDLRLGHCPSAMSCGFATSDEGIRGMSADMTETTSSTLCYMSTALASSGIPDNSNVYRKAFKTSTYLPKSIDSSSTVEDCYQFEKEA